MKILLLTDGIYPYTIGGMQKHSYYLSKYFSKNKIEVHILHTSNKKIELSKYYDKNELKYLKFTSFQFPTSIWYPGHYLFNSLKLSKIYYNHSKKLDYDIIYAQGFTSWYFLIKEKFKKGLISNLHGLNMYQPSINLIDFLKKQMLKMPASKIIKCSLHQVSLGGKLTQILLNAGAQVNSINIIPNAVDDNFIINRKIKFLNSNKKIRFCFIGRYDKVKGVKELNSFLKLIVHENKICIDFIGPIPKNKRISNENIKYHGLIHDTNYIKDILVSSDILISPSYSEGMPTVILEAMACGCAILATDVGANEDIVDLDNGWLIENPSIKNLLEAYHVILNDTDSLDSKKRSSIAKIHEYYEWDNVIKNTIKVFISMIEKR